MDNAVDGLDEAIKLYVTKLIRGSLDESEGRRAMAIVSFRPRINPLLARRRLRLPRLPVPAAQCLVSRLTLPP
jgi:hypothetical protein